MFDVKKGNGSINHRRSQRAKAVKLVGTTDLQFEMEGIIVGESPHITKIVVKAQGKLAMKELTFEFFSVWPLLSRKHVNVPRRTYFRRT